jgi:predicted DNA binding CopG/RHH family protein
MARKKTLQIRISEEELKQIKKNAKNAQLTVSEYLRTMAIYKEVK